MQQGQCFLTVPLRLKMQNPTHSSSGEGSKQRPQVVPKDAQQEVVTSGGLRWSCVTVTVLDMVVTRHWAFSPADVGVAVPARVEACTQTELQTVAAALQVQGCRESLGALSEARGDGLLLHRSCPSKWRSYGRMSTGITEERRDIDRIFSATQEPEDPQTSSMVEKQVLSTPTTKGSQTSGDGKDGGSWLLTPRGRILPHLRAYNCKTGSTSSKSKRRCADKQSIWST